MKKQALVVDNDFFFVEFLTDILLQRGYEIVKAYNGIEGILKLNTCHIDILFVNMVMPKIDGKQLIQYTREHFPDTLFPIVAISGTLIDQLNDVHDIGADFYLTKAPVNTMTHQINRLLDRLEHQPFQSITDPEFQESIPLFPRQSTAELIAVMDFQEAFFNCIGLGVFIADEDAVIIKANETGLELLEKSIGDVLSSHVTTLVPDAEKLRFVGALKNIARERWMKQIMVPVWVKTKKIGITISLLKINQEPAGWIIVMEDLKPWGDSSIHEG
jgi:CheY-like chemotaxis protein